MSEGSRNKGANFLPGLIFGAIAGAVAGILFAPDKGEKTRKRLQKEYEGLRDQAGEKLSQLNALKEEHLSDLPKRVKAELEGVKRQVNKAKTVVKQRLENKALEDDVIQ